MCTNCCTASSHAGTGSHRGLSSIWIVLLTLTLSNAVTAALDIDYDVKREWECSWIFNQTLFPSRSLCRDTSELSGKKCTDSDGKCSRWGWSFHLCRLALHQTITVWTLCLKPPPIHSKWQEHRDQWLFVFFPDAIASFLGSSQWKVKSIYETSEFSGMRKYFHPYCRLKVSCYFLKYILRNCVLRGLGFKPCMYCFRQLMPQVSFQYFGHHGVYDNVTKC